MKIRPRQLPRERPALRNQALTIAGTEVGLGQTADIALKISESYMGIPVEVPVRVIRASEPGPTLLLTAAIHGDELNGTGIVREIMFRELELRKGSVVCMPVVNVFGLENHSRYLPDRRDLNRSFPGREEGSLAYRLAHAVFSDVVAHCDYGIDLHTAAVRRTNFPHVRGDLNIPEVKQIAFAFGCELVVHKKGSAHTLRSVACKHGCATMLYEAGEVLKFEPTTIRLGVRGVLNVLKNLGMLAGEPVMPAYQTRVKKTRWVRADSGGLLRFRVRPGDLVKKGEPLAACDKFFTQASTEITAPVSGIVLSMTTLPAVKPGQPVCHLAVPAKSIDTLQKEAAESPKTLHRRLQQELGTSFAVEQPPGNEPR